MSHLITPKRPTMLNPPPTPDPAPAPGSAPGIPGSTPAGDPATGQDACGQAGSPPRPRRVIVAGYGPVGRTVVDQLEADGFEVKVVELNLITIERQLGLDRDVIYGDVADPKILAAAGLAAAEALILTIPDEAASLKACQAARRLAPQIYIAVRTNHVSGGLLATQAGADEVIVEEVITAQSMTAAVCRCLAKPNPRRSDASPTDAQSPDPPPSPNAT